MDGTAHAGSEGYDAIEAGSRPPAPPKSPELRGSMERDIRVSIEAFRGPPAAGTMSPMAQSMPEAPILDKEGVKGSLLDAIPESGRVGVQFRGVNGWVPATFQKPGMGRALQKIGSKIRGEQPAGARRQILYNVCGSVSPGEVLALMGPSGSGKTSFISVLGGRKPKLMEADGDILFNGRPLNKAMKRRIGFVLQDDLMYASLTVEETLYYAAMLRLPKTMTRAQKKQRVDTVIEALGLGKCRDTLI
eukprot:evm.model.scf_570.3 EVM.evm.TU.scf_570.3   scf_570:75122-78373(+)